MFSHTSRRIAPLTCNPITIHGNNISALHSIPPATISSTNKVLASATTTTTVTTNIINNSSNSLKMMLGNTQIRCMGANRWKKGFKGKKFYTVRLNEEKKRKQKHPEEVPEEKKQKIQGFFSYQPKTDFEKQFLYLNLYLNQYPVAPMSEKPVKLMLDKVSNEEELIMTLHIWKKIAYRNEKPSPELTEKLFNKFFEIMNDIDTPILRAPQLYGYLKMFLKEGKKDDCLELFQSVLDKEFIFKPTPQDYLTMMTLLAEEGLYEDILQVFDMHTNNLKIDPVVEHLLPTYELVLKASKETGNTEKVERIHKELQFFKYGKEKERILEEYSDLFAKLSENGSDSSGGTNSENNVDIPLESSSQEQAQQGQGASA